MLTRRDIFLRTDSAVPPDAFGLRAVFRKEDFKSSLSIIARLVPGALPQAIRDRSGREATAMLSIWPISVLVERRFIALVILNFDDVPFSNQVDSRWSLGILAGMY